MICEQLAPAPAIIDRREPETGDDVKAESDDEEDITLMELLGGLGSAASVATKWSMSGLSNVRSAVKTTVSQSGELSFIWFNGLSSIIINCLFLSSIGINCTTSVFTRSCFLLMHDFGSPALSSIWIGINCATLVFPLSLIMFDNTPYSRCQTTPKLAFQSSFL